MMPVEEKRLDQLQGLFHELDKKVERILTLMEGTAKQNGEIEGRLRSVEDQTRENTQALRIVRWVGGVLLAVGITATAYLVKAGIDTMGALVRLARP